MSASPYRHRPPDWSCPFCGIANRQNAKRLDDLIYEDDRIISFISRDWWPNNPGHVLIVPRKHYENIYELPFVVSDRIHRMAKRVAIALKAVHSCDGVSTRQHNEPAGNQDVWHYHLHIFPRFNGDQLYLSQKQLAPPEERARHAAMLRDYFTAHPPDLDND